ncbi:MAG: zf-HC2 domain-containing protein [Armatimonadetes bacterium]|nr:zf-HC2 domain-containing protein [Armatimonadota bacterium]
MRVRACEDRQEDLAALLDGDLGPWRRWRLRRHIDDCRDCTAWARQSQQDVAAFRKAVLPAPDPEFIARVMGGVRSLPQPAPARAWIRPITRPLLVAAAVGVLAAWFIIGRVLGPVWDPSRQAVCAEALRQLSRAVNVYAMEFDGQLPPAERWSGALASYQRSPHLPCCPLAGNPGPGSGYSYNPQLSRAQVNAIPDISTVPLLYDSRGGSFDPRHAGVGNIAFLPGSVQAFEKPPEPLRPRSRP